MSSNKKNTARKGKRGRQQIPRTIVVRERAPRRVVKRRAPARKPQGLLDILGGVLSKGLSAAISMFGDYKVEQNAFMPGNSPPMVVNSNTGESVILRHREYLGDILSTTAFTNSAYPLNPGDPITFPWLSQVATSFEEYEFRGVIFEFKSMSSDALLATAAGTALGVVVMATEYDSLEADFTDKHQMENHAYANSGKPSISFIHPIECKRSATPLTRLYVRNSGTPPSGADLRMYDLGKFQIATQGMQVAGGILGELWISYEVALFKPHIIASTGGDLLVDHYRITGAASATPLGTSQSLQAGSYGMTTISGQTLYFDNFIASESFLICACYVGSGASLVAPILTLTRCTGKTIFSAGTTSIFSNSTSTAGAYIQLQAITVTSAAPTVAYGAAGTLPSAITFADLFVLQIPNALTSVLMQTAPMNVDQLIGALPDSVIKELTERLCPKSSFSLSPELADVFKSLYVNK